MSAPGMVSADKIEPGTIRAVIFDLDGTLVDSLADIAFSLNVLMADEGLAVHDEEAVRRMIGRGVRNLVERAFAANDVALDGAALDDATARYVAIYEPRAQIETRPYPGVIDVVTRLAARGVPLAVCTNKPTAVSRAIVDGLGLGTAIGHVLGGDYGPARKPAPDMLLEAARLMEVAPSACAMVGDSEADVASAKAAEMPVIVVPYGYTALPADQLGADVVATDFDDVGAVLDRWIGAGTCAG